MLQLTFLRLTIIPIGGGAPKKENDTPKSTGSNFKRMTPIPKRWVDDLVVIRCVMDVCCLVGLVTSYLMVLIREKQGIGS